MLNLFEPKYQRGTIWTRCHGMIAVVSLIAISIIVPLLLFNSFTADASPEDKSGSKAKNEKSADTLLNKIGVSRGICVVLGDAKLELALELARQSELLIYVQLPKATDVEKARQAADAAGLYGTRIYVEKGALTSLHLADNIADALIAVGEAAKIAESEALRILRPEGKALLGGKELIKSFPPGVDDWSHPYHGPDNNPQSKDRLARAPYLTQFLADPRYAPVPQVAVASAGRVFKAFGHVAFKKREEAYLNKLVAFNGYNGTILWERDLPTGMMVHRNTFIATPATLYVGDESSCKLIDTVTGELKDEIIPSIKVAGGTFWKWMGLADGVLYALIGEAEHKDETTRHGMRNHGWPWNKVSEGYNQPKNPWGFGRTVIAIDLKTKEVLWNYREDELIDSRAMCMKNGRIYIFRHLAYLACLDAKSGKVIWRRTKDDAPELFELLGECLEGQGWTNNWRTAAFLKCSDKALYFAGTAVGKLVAVSAEDGSILWQNPYGRFQLVLRDDVLYAAAAQRAAAGGKKFDPITGEVLLDVNMGRRACTRPTGSIDAIFYRAMGGTVRYDIATETEQWISPMRPNCHDGVTIANGLLYWWPSVCDCQNSLFGVTCLGPAGDFEFNQEATESERLEKVAADLKKVASLPESPSDWTTFRGNNIRNVTTAAVIPETNNLLWQSKPKTTFTPTAPVVAGGMVFISGSDGIVQAFDAVSGNMRWKAYTGGEVRYPPTIWKGRALVASGDGWIYAFEAKKGQLLWRFRAAPAERKIPVYGSLLSTWPATSGVLVEDGIAYVAAGILNYDGTHVYALDATTGEIKWQNNTSGHLIPEARTGVSVQGHLLLHDKKLYLPGGTSISPAIYDIKDGKFLNAKDEIEGLRSCASKALRGCELYQIGDYVAISGKPMYAHPKYPVYDPTVFEKMLLASTNNLDVAWINNRKVLCFTRIDRQILNDCVAKARGRGHIVASWGKLKVPDKPLWEYDCEGSVAMALCKNAVVIAKEAEIVALSLQDGQLLWSNPLPSPPVSFGLAVSHDGHIIVTLEDGRILCFGQVR
ncbi:PQQ-binding-like beta-propeller repeat protein [bacterium]|nr:PQQ-binding-like beta-propeller repeat protein [bacterium]